MIFNPLGNIPLFCIGFSFHPQLVDTLEQAMSGVRFQNLSHTKNGSEGIILFHTGGRFQKEVLSGVIKFNYNIILCVKNIDIFR